jgi:phosphomannomutase
MVASTVSSKMIEAMATAEGFKFVECLTGYSFSVGRAFAIEFTGT